MLRLIANSLPKRLGSRGNGRVLQVEFNWKRSSNTASYRSEFKPSRTDRRQFQVSQYHTNNISRSSNDILGSLCRSAEQKAGPLISEKDDDPRLWDKTTVYEWLTKYENVPTSHATIVYENNIVGASLCDEILLTTAGVDSNSAQKIARTFCRVTKPTSHYLRDTAREVLDRLEKPKFEDAAREQDLNFRHTLGPLAGESSLAFNPLNPTIDLRLMPRQLDDEVFKTMENAVFEKEGKPITVLKAISGSGVTGTMLNAVGRNAYLIYVQGNIVYWGAPANSIMGQDYVDFSWNRLVQRYRVQWQCGETEISKEKSVRICQLFWLAHLMTLDYLCEKWALTASEWLFWSNTHGVLVIDSILENLFLSNEIRTGLPKVREEMINYYTKKHSVWFAIDEAQYLQCVRREDTDLLHDLCLYSLPNFAKRIVGGTNIYHDFEQSLASGRFNDISYTTTESLPEYPYVEQEKVIEVVGRFINLKNITPENIELAKWQLEGRARHAFRFIVEVYLTADRYQYKGQKLTIDLQNEIFREALYAHKRATECYIRRRIKFLKEEWAVLNKARGGKTFTPEENFQEVMEHIAFVVDQGFQNKWLNAKELEDKFALSPIQLGFCYVQRRDGSEYYTMKEPFLREVLINNEDFFHLHVNTRWKRNSTRNK